jgi:hypothetical protein
LISNRGHTTVAASFKDGFLRLLSFNGGMSDIDLPNMDALLLALFALIVMAPSFVFGIACLLLQIFIPSRRSTWLAFYFAASMATIVGGMWWCADWFNLPELCYFSVPVAIVSSVGMYGLFLGTRRVVNWMRGKTRKKAIISDPSASSG